MQVLPEHPARETGGSAMQCSTLSVGSDSFASSRQGSRPMQIQGPHTFLGRPFWRDYVVAYLLIGLGYMFSGPTAPVHPAVGVVMLACGAMIFICAIGWSLLSLVDNGVQQMRASSVEGLSRQGNSTEPPMPVKPIRDGFHTITPYLFVAGASRLIEFLSKAFGGQEIFRKARPDGGIMHAEIRIGDSMLMLGEPGGAFGPMPTSIYFYVPDCDAVYQRALDAGGTSVFKMMSLPSGERYGGVKDPCGNIWWIATHVEDVSPEEEDRRWQEFQRQAQAGMG
jgi:PhnB protein